MEARFWREKNGKMSSTWSGIAEVRRWCYPVDIDVRYPSMVGTVAGDGVAELIVPEFRKVESLSSMTIDEGEMRHRLFSLPLRWDDSDSDRTTSPFGGRSVDSNGGLKRRGGAFGQDAEYGCHLESPHERKVEIKENRIRRFVGAIGNVKNGRTFAHDQNRMLK
ncbi:hypothetical protein ACLOJK_022177 [Asimina triloba]